MKVIGSTKIISAIGMTLGIEFNSDGNPYKVDCEDLSLNPVSCELVERVAQIIALERVHERDYRMVCVDHGYQTRVEGRCHKCTLADANQEANQCD